MNPHCNSIDEINFGKLLDIFIEKALTVYLGTLVG